MVKGTRLLAGATAIAAVAATSYFLLRPHDKPAGAQEPQRGQDSGSRRQEQKVGSPTPNTQHPTPSSPSLTLLGTIMGEQRQLSTRQPARIVGVYAKEGQAVQAGQLLVQLDTAEIRAGENSANAGIRLAQAQADKARSGRTAQLVKADADVQAAQTGIAQAQAKVRQAQLAVQAARQSDQADLQTAQQAVRKAEAGVKTAQTQLHSLEELAKVGGVARNDLEGARTQAQIAQTDLESLQEVVRRVQDGPPNQPKVTFRVANAQQELGQAQSLVTQARQGLQTAQAARTQVAHTADAEIRAAEAAVAQARAGLATAQIGNQSARLTSPISGIASTVNAHVGETAQPGVPLLILSSASGARIEALVPARQLSLLRIGQSAQVTLDTRPNQPLSAVLSAISAVAEPDGRAFRVTFRFTTPPAGLRVGQTARIAIQVRVKSESGE